LPGCNGIGGGLQGSPWEDSFLVGLEEIAGLPIYSQVYDEYTPWNEELYGFDEILKEKYHSECAR
jgi:hypothetical protein